MEEGTNKLTEHLRLIFWKPMSLKYQTKVGFDNNAGFYFIWRKAGSFLGHHVASNTEHPLALAACGLPQYGMDETFACLMYFTNKKLLQNVWNSPNLWAEKEIPRDPIFFFGKILG